MIALEKEALALVQATDAAPYIHELPVNESREKLEELQTAELTKPLTYVSEKKISVAGIDVKIFTPDQVADTKKPAILYIHGAGWALGSSNTHNQLVRKLSLRSNTTVVFPEYSRTPNAIYPQAIEEIYKVAQWLRKNDEFDGDSIMVGGDSVGGNMAAALALMAKERRDVQFRGQLLFYPVTDCNFDRKSYKEFATGYYLRRDSMKWFWGQYDPTKSKRGEYLASPLRATKEQLSGLPAAMILTAEADVLRDEGEAYAAKLIKAGVHVHAMRFLGTIHDFVMLNALARTAAAKEAVKAASSFIARRVGPNRCQCH